MISGTLPIRVADGEVDGDAVSDAGCQPQDPVLPAAAGKEPAIAAADDGLPVDMGEFGDAVGDRGAGGDEAGEVIAVQPSGADDQFAGCFEGVESGGAGADGVSQSGFRGMGAGHDGFCSLAAGAGRRRTPAARWASWRSRVIS